MPATTSFAALAISMLFGMVAGSDAASPPPPAPAQPAYQLVDLTDCKKPQVAPPPPRTERYAAFGFQRRLLDLDGSGHCVLMDVWTARLGGSAAAGMRRLEHRFARVVGGRWQPFDTDLAYFPHALKAGPEGKVYLVEAHLDADRGDQMVAPEGGPRVLTVAAWRQEAGFLSVLELHTEVAQRTDVLRALAALLRARSGGKGVKMGAEQARIRMLEKAAAEAGQ